MRGKYAQAGYAGNEMYIANVPAGSAQDELRDFNRAGYRSDRPWDEAPVPVFEAMEGGAVAAPAQRRRQAKERTFLEYLAHQAKKERADVIACICLLALIMVMTAMWGQNMIRGAKVQQSINSFHASTVAFERDNERIEQKLELARDGERIRNLAQNELGMLRPERAINKTIYIQQPEDAAETTLQNHEEPRMEMLDVLLGLLNMLHIGE